MDHQSHDADKHHQRGDLIECHDPCRRRRDSEVN
jgi:hypothetical protein